MNVRLMMLKFKHYYYLLDFKLNEKPQPYSFVFKFIIQ